MGQYRNPSRSADTGPVSVNVPTAASTYTMGTGERTVYFNHTGTIATFTVKLPTSDVSGDTIMLKFRSAVTTLALQNYNGVAISGAPTAATAGQAIYLRNIDSTIGWIAW